MRYPRPILVLMSLVFLLLAGTSSFAKAPVRWTLRRQPARVVNGSPVLLRVTTPQPVRTLSGSWLGHEIFFSFDASQKVWVGLAGVSLETKPGTYPIQLRGETSAGPTITYEQGIRVLHQRYPRVLLKVPTRYTAPSPEEQREIAQDKEIKAQAFQIVSAERQWKSSFDAPVKAPISDVFGVERVFNGAVQSSHQGLDFRVPSGTSVAAANRGTVLLARPLFFEGNCIVIDHGQGLLTLYLHLSQLRVKQGDQVAKGQPIALSGGTGLATGPHLHLAVRWQGIYLDPEVLLSLPLP